MEQNLYWLKGFLQGFLIGIIWQFFLFVLLTSIGCFSIFGVYCGQLLWIFSPLNLQNLFYTSSKVDVMRQILGWSSYPVLFGFVGLVISLLRHKSYSER